MSYFQIHPPSKSSHYGVRGYAEDVSPEIRSACGFATDHSQLHPDVTGGPIAVGHSSMTWEFCRRLPTGGRVPLCAPRAGAGPRTGWYMGNAVGSGGHREQCKMLCDGDMMDRHGSSGCSFWREQCDDSPGGEVDPPDQRRDTRAATVASPPIGPGRAGTTDGGRMRAEVMASLFHAVRRGLSQPLVSARLSPQVRVVLHEFVQGLNSRECPKLSGVGPPLGELVETLGAAQWRQVPRARG